MAEKMTKEGLFVGLIVDEQPSIKQEPVKDEQPKEKVVKPKKTIKK